jgi:hypothetical protein
MTASQLFTSFWWLIFPLFGMGMGLVGMLGHFRHRSETLKLIKSYADQGKEPPAALLDALRSDEDRAYDHGYYRRRCRNNGVRWGGVITFGALAAGFGYFGYYGEGGSTFIALATGFGVAALFMLIIGITRSLSAARYRDDRLDDDLKK